MSISQLLERRDAAKSTLSAIHAAHPDGALPTEAETRWNAVTAELSGIEASIKRQATIDELERRAIGTPFGGSTGDTGFDALAAKVSAVDVIRAQMGGTDAGAGRAREVSQEIEKRSGRKAEGLFFHMGVSGAQRERRVFETTAPSGGPGSALIQTTVLPTLADILRARVLARKMGATVLGGLTGNLNIPRLKASATASWVAEGGVITATDPETDDISLTPKHVGGIVEMSRNMLMQSSVDVVNMVEMDLSKLIAQALDQAAIVGGGSNQPNGLLASGSGISLVHGGTNGLAISWANVQALIKAVDTSNALDGSLGFLTNGLVTAAMRQTLKTTSDTASNFIQTDPNSLAGYPLGSTQNVPNTLTRGSGTALSPLIFGDWSQLIIGFWSELDILVNPYESTAYSKGNVQVRCMATADIELRHPLAFAALDDVIAS